MFVYFQAARSVLHSVEPVNQMAEDLGKIDVINIIEPTLWMSSKNKERDFNMIYNCKFSHIRVFFYIPHVDVSKEIKIYYI